MPRVDVGDVSVYHEFHGDGPPLLHISGTGGDLRTSAPHVHALNADFRGLHYDQRGLGRTSIGDRHPTMADFADDAAGLCVAVGWDRCHVVGTSFGGMVAQHLAIRHPALVERLVLSCTSPGGEAPSYPLHELQSMPPTERADAWMRIMDTRYRPGGEIPGLEGFTEMLRSWQSAPLGPDATEGLARQLEARRIHDATAGLPTISSPTLVCAGRYDGIAPLRNAEVIVEAIPNASFEVFEGGHVFMLQDPRAMPRIREFLLG